MSGGSYDYACHRIEQFADDMERGRRQGENATPERRAFITLVRKVAEAAHAIEWVDSGDYAKGDETKHIREALGENADALIMQEAVKSARESIVTLQALLEIAIERGSKT